MHFSQIAGSKGGNFSELRSYLVAKLLWDVDCDIDSVAVANCETCCFCSAVNPHPVTLALKVMYIQFNINHL